MPAVTQWELTGAFCCLSAIQPRPGAQSESTGFLWSYTEVHRLMPECEARFLPTGAQGYGTPHNAPLRVLPVDSLRAPGPIASSERLFLRFAHGFFGRFARWCVEREWHVSIPPRILKAPEGPREPMLLKIRRMVG